MGEHISIYVILCVDSGLPLEVVNFWSGINKPPKKAVPFLLLFFSECMMFNQSDDHGKVPAILVN